MLQNVAFYRKAWSISATQPRENEKAVVTGSHRGLCWKRVFAHSLLHGRGITWITMGEVKIHLLKGKCWIKRLKILRNTSNNYTQVQIKNRRVNNNLKHIILLKTTQSSPKMIYVLSTCQTPPCLNCFLSSSNAKIKNIHSLLRIDIGNIQMAKLIQR